jgi:hypothetical protein
MMISAPAEAVVSFCEICDFGRAYKPIVRSTILPAIRLEEGFSITVNVVEFPHVAPFEKAKKISLCHILVAAASCFSIGGI